MSDELIPDVLATEKSFFETLPDDLRANVDFAKYKDMAPADLVKSHAELSGRVKEALIPPAETATDEEKAAYNTRLRQVTQVPDTPEGYKVELPEGIPADDPLLKAFAVEAHKAGASPAAVQAGVNAFVGYMKQMETEAQAAFTQQKDALKIELGAKYDEYIRASEGAMRELGIEAGFKPEEVQDMLERTGLKNNVMFIKMFGKASRFFEEGRLNGTGQTAEKTLAEKFFPGLESK